MNRLNPNNITKPRILVVDDTPGEYRYLDRGPQFALRDYRGIGRRHGHAVGEGVRTGI